MLEADEVHEPRLGFKILKPAGWTLLPRPWALSARRRFRTDDGEAQEFLRAAQAPFVYMQHDHGSSDHVLPTTQVIALVAREAIELDAFLEQSLANVRKLHPHYELEHASSEAVFAGRRVATYRLVASVQGARDGRQFEFRNRVYLIPSAEYVFTVGVSSSTDPRFACEADLAAILASVRLDSGVRGGAARPF